MFKLSLKYKCSVRYVLHNKSTVLHLKQTKKIKPRNHSHILAVTSVYTFTKIFNYNIHITAFFPQIDGSLSRTF